MTRPRWIKSTSCNGAATCVEVAPLPDGGVAVRDSKHPDGVVLRFSGVEWQAVIDSYRNPAGFYEGPFHLIPRESGWLMWRQGDTERALRFTPPEVEAFEAGVKAGHFDLAVLAGDAGDGTDGDAPGSVSETSVAREGAASVSQ